MTLTDLQTCHAGLSASASLLIHQYFFNFHVTSFYYCTLYVNDTGLIQWRILVSIVAAWGGTISFIIFGLFTMPNMCPPDTKSWRRHCKYTQWKLKVDSYRLMQTSVLILESSSVMLYAQGFKVFTVFGFIVRFFYKVTHNTKRCSRLTKLMQKKGNLQGKAN